MPDIDDAEIQAVIETMKSRWLTTGPKTLQFETEFAEYLGVKHALAVNSATAGLHLALEAIGIGPGDKVVTSPMTFTATAEVIRHLGADPVFVDIDPATLNIDADLIEDKLRGDPSVKAIMPVHYGGQAANLDKILALARHYDLRVIEDAAHALPTEFDGAMIGTIGDATVFSFYATKTLAIGEGGMVVTNDDAIAERVRLMRLHGISKDVFDRHEGGGQPTWQYEVIAPGYKYNLTDLASAIGLEQLRKLGAGQRRRKEIAARYSRGLAGAPLRLPSLDRPADTHSWHLYVVQLELERLSIVRDQVIELLHEAGVGTSVHFIPLHMQPYWRDRYELRPEQFPCATDSFYRLLSLPIYPAMSDRDCDHVIRSLELIAAKFGNVRKAIV